MNTTIIQKAIVKNNDGDLLILRRSNTDTRRPLEWDLPGGLFEYGEEMLFGVEREIKEETGLEVTGTKAVYSKTEHRIWENGEANAVFLFYLADAVKGNVVLSNEHDMYKWVTLKEAIDLIKYDLHKELLIYLQTYKLLK